MSEPAGRAARLVFVAIASTLSLAACSSDSDTISEVSGREVSEPLAKNDTGEIRVDLEPLTDRFAVLGEPLDAVWASGAFGDERVPGPSLFWIDAIVTVSADTALEMRSVSEPLGDFSEFALVDGIAGVVPDGLYLGGVELSDEFADDTWSVVAAVHADLDVVVLSAVGE